ncbi:hypothetical protein AeNC1_011193 [Aphanomyces euteiches]|nr:hypothetical protein AeNC1_011193 [Aphanomyces euteiches]
MHLLPMLDFKTLDAKFLTSHRFFIGCALCFLLVFVGYDISHANSVVTTRKALALSDREETLARQTRRSSSSSATGVEPSTTKAPRTRPAESCRVQFAFAGSKYDYGQFPTLKSWIRYTDPKCAIDFLRSNHPFMTQLTAAQSRMYYESDYLPILQADMLKMFSVYYLGGVAVDLDVKRSSRFLRSGQVQTLR